MHYIFPLVLTRQGETVNHLALVTTRPFLIDSDYMDPEVHFLLVYLFEATSGDTWWPRALQLPTPIQWNFDFEIRGNQWVCRIELVKRSIVAEDVSYIWAPPQGPSSPSKKMTTKKIKSCVLVAIQWMLIEMKCNIFANMCYYDKNSLKT